METIAPANGVHKDVTDLYGDQFTVALAQAMTRLEHAPYWHQGEKAPSRLVRAGELVRLSRVQLHDERTATVHGSTKPYDLTGFHCTCPQSQKGQSMWCVHAVAVKLARTLAQEDGQGEDTPLPLGPVTVDERLALGTVRDATAFSTPHTPQEAPMPDNDDAYIPEPEDAPVAVEDPPAPAPLRIPREYTVQIKGRTHVLYTGLVVTARTQGLMSLSADWTYNDAELSLAHAVCTFADGRRYEESGDATPSNVSKGIAAHFRRVALTRAKARCLRDALGISECSVEELEEDTGKREVPDMTQQLSEKDLRRRIWKIVQYRTPEVKSREAVEAWVQEQTGMALHPDFYQAILTRLQEMGA